MRSRRKGDIGSSLTSPAMRAVEAPDDAPTAIVTPPDASGRAGGEKNLRSGPGCGEKNRATGPDAGEDNGFDPESSDVSWSSTEPVPGERGFIGGAVDRVEAFLLLHVTPTRTIAAAAVAAALGLGTWISLATSGSTTTTSVLSLRTVEPSQEPAPDGRETRTRSLAQRGASGSARGTSAIEIGDAMRLEPIPDSSVDASRSPAEEPQAASPPPAEPPGETRQRDSIAAEPLVFNFGREPAVHPAPGGGAAETAPAGKASRATGSVPTGREAMVALGERHSGALEDCIDGAARSGDAQWLGRRVRLVMTFGADGRVSSADVEDDEMAETTLAGCIRNVAKRVSLPPFEGGPVTVAVPLRLGSER